MSWSQENLDRLAAQSAGDAPMRAQLKVDYQKLARMQEAVGVHAAAEISLQRASRF